MPKMTMRERKQYRARQENLWNFPTRESGLPNYFEDAQEIIGPRLRRISGDTEATRANSFEALNYFAVVMNKRDPRVGLLEKRGGARVRDRASDIIAINLGNGTCQLFDVIGDSEGEDGSPRVGWGQVAESDEGVRPIDQWKLPYPVDEVVDPPTPPPTGDIERRMTALEAKVDAALRSQSARLDSFVEQVQEILNRAISRDDIAAIVSENLGRVRVSADVQKAGPRVRIFGQTINLEHDHDVEISLSLDGARVQHEIRRATQSAPEVSVVVPEDAGEVSKPKARRRKVVNIRSRR